jgi:hypothetical protein
VRVTLHDYRFTDAPERRATGACWRRREIGPYAPVYDRSSPRARSNMIGGAASPVMLTNAPFERSRRVAMDFAGLDLFQRRPFPAEESDGRRTGERVAARLAPVRGRAPALGRRSS